ncbi:hypothetical protein CVS40_11611 [Lucilia cuprina]|nr:hypothetical protein CVS40_11611 [Lucilia cuprina]
MSCDETDVSLSQSTSKSTTQLVKTDWNCQLTRTISLPQKRSTQTSQCCTSTKEMVRVTQINFHHSKAASAALVLRMGVGVEELALEQEPWIHQGKIISCLVAKSSLNITPTWETSVDAILVISAYMAHDHSHQPPNNLVRRFIEMVNSKGMPIIIGADANAHQCLGKLGHKRWRIRTDLYSPRPVDFAKSYRQLLQSRFSFRNHEETGRPAARKPWKF